MFDKVLYYTGSYGPSILIATALFLLRNTPNQMVVFSIGTLLNLAINYVLKGIIREPRPDSKNLKIEDRYRYVKDFNKFGMPSGHAQSVWFSTIFVFLATKQPYNAFYMALLSVVTMVQRVTYRRHSVNQVLVGSLLGVALACVAFSYVSSLSKGGVKDKTDDNYYGLNLSSQYLNFSFW